MVTRDSPAGGDGHVCPRPDTGHFRGGIPPISVVNSRDECASISAKSGRRFHVSSLALFPDVGLPEEKMTVLAEPNGTIV